MTRTQVNEPPPGVNDDDGVRPLLILGIGRSGTTLLMQLLGTAPRILFDRVYPFEVRYLAYLQQWSLVLSSAPAANTQSSPGSFVAPPPAIVGPLPYPGAQMWDGQAMRRAAIVAGWKAFAKAATARAGVSGESPLYYAEKSPFWMPAACRETMRYRSVVLVRDPRDVFVSVRAFDAKRGVAGFGFSGREGEREEDHALRFADACRIRLRISREELGTPHSILVRYEDLVADLAKEARRLGMWLGVALDAERVVSHILDFDHHTTSASAAASVGRWHRELGTGVAQMLTDELRDELQCFGYAT